MITRAGMLLRCVTLVALGAVLLPTRQASGKAEEPGAIPEISVQAPEPRYVAPTRHDRIGRIWAPVLINGQGPFRLVLDTGATRSAVTARVADSLALPRDPDGLMLHGVTGSAAVPAIRAESLEVGELITRGSALPIVEDAFGGAEGVLGSEGLGDMRVLIEFNADRISILRSHNQRAREGFITIPMEFLSGRVPSVPAIVGGVRARAVIDTGAQATVGNLALRMALLHRHGNLQRQSQEVIGVTQDVQNGESLAVARIDLGGMELRGAHITFVDLDIFSHWKLLDEPTVVIGMDVLGLLDTLIIDYRRRELQVRFNDPAAASRRAAAGAPDSRPLAPRG